MEAGGHGQGGVTTPDPIATTVRMDQIVWGCVGRIVLAGGSYALTAARMWGAICTIGTDVLMDETRCSVG